MITLLNPLQQRHDKETTVFSVKLLFYRESSNWRKLYLVSYCHFSLLTNTGVTFPHSKGQSTFGVELLPQLNTSEIANQDFMRITKRLGQVCWGKLKLNSAGRWSSRSTIGQPWMNTLKCAHTHTIFFFGYFLIHPLAHSLTVWRLASPNLSNLIFIKILMS